MLAGTYYAARPAVFTEGAVTGNDVVGHRHRLPLEERPCPFCGALLYTWEKVRGSLQNPIFNLCCLAGRVVLPPLHPLPDPLPTFFTASTPEAVLFRHNIRKYNNMLAFSSIGLNADETLANGTAKKIERCIS